MTKGKEKKDETVEKTEEKTHASTEERCTKTPEEAAIKNAGAETDQTKKAEADQKKRDEKDERFLRLLADFDNFRKRTLRERAEFQRQAIKSVIIELLPALDGLDAALAFMSANEISPVVTEGIKKVADQFAAALRKLGVERIDAAIGEVFDPTKHEAVTVCSSQTVPKHCIVQQIRPGYVLGRNLIRPAQTVVSSGPATDEAGTAKGVPKLENSGG